MHPLSLRLLKLVLTSRLCLIAYTMVCNVVTCYLTIHLEEKNQLQELCAEENDWLFRERIAALDEQIKTLTTYIEKKESHLYVRVLPVNFRNRRYAFIN